MESKISLEYIVGFFDGEGSVIIRFKEDQRYVTGIHVEPWINITNSNKPVLELIKSFLKAGTLTFHNRDQLWHFNIRAFEDLLRIIELFIPFSIVKRNKLESFLKILKLMKNKKHLTPDGIKQIQELWYPETVANTP
jgi:intein-encoded DNA endonuclease-like protein